MISNDNVFVTKNKTYHVHIIRSIKSSTKPGNHVGNICHSKWNLTNVSYVPKLSLNLVSIGQLT